MTAKKKPMAEMLKSSLGAEKASVSQRFDKADNILPKLAPEPSSTPEREGVVRMAYSIPASETEMIEEMLLQAARHGCRINRSELVRTALYALRQMDEGDFMQAIQSLDRLRPGRPSNK